MLSLVTQEINTVRQTLEWPKYKIYEDEIILAFFDPKTHAITKSLYTATFNIYSTFS